MLLQEFKCAICLCLIQNTTATPCLHRFCYDCILSALRLGKKECPSCRLPIPSKRNLRKDSRYDEMIGLLYPDYKEPMTDSTPIEPIDLLSIETPLKLKGKLNKRLYARSSQSKTQHGNPSHEQNLEMLRNASQDSLQAHSMSTSSDGGEDLGCSSANSWNIEIELIPYPKESIFDKLESIHVKTMSECPGNTLTHHLINHLSKQHSIKVDKLNLFVYNGKKLVPIDLQKPISNAMPSKLDFVTIYYKSRV